MIMKKIYSFLTVFALSCMSCFAGDVEDLSLTTGWNCNLEQESTAPMYPSQVTLGGQWQDIRICDESFDAKEWVRYKVVFAEAFEDGETVQIMVRNAAEASSYGGNYYPIAAGVTEVEGTLNDNPFTDDDFVCTVLAIQNRTTSQVVFTINDVILYKEDGTEWHPNLVNDWGSSYKKLGEGEVTEYYSFGQWGTLMHDFGSNVVPDEGDVHRFTVTSSEPFPENLQWKVIRGSDDSNALYPGAFTVGETTATLELDNTNIVKSEDDEINYYTGVAIQATASATLPADVTMTREIIYGNGALSRETMPIIGGYGATVIDPNPAEDVSENGLPTRVIIPGSWGAIKLWLDSFDVTEYPGYKIVLREKPEDETVQVFYRTETHGSSGGIYVPWATSEEYMTTLSEDGTTLTGEFDIDALEGDNTVLAFALQNLTSSSVSVVVEAVYLINEDGEEIATSGLTASGLWNGGTITPLGGSYDDEGNIYDAYVEWASKYGWVGPYSGEVEENTFHRFTFYTDEPIPDGVSPVCFDSSFSNIETTSNGAGTTVFSVDIPASYSMFALQYLGEEDALPIKIRFTKIIREVFESSTTGIQQINASNASTVAGCEIFNASGVRISKPAKGINIIKETMSDGSVKTMKVIIR